MPYTVPATANSPALIIFLLDESGSMTTACGGESRLQVVQKAFQCMVARMVQRSLRGTTISSRYRLAMFAYSSTIRDMLGGIKTIEEVARGKLPELKSNGTTRMKLAFTHAEALLERELKNMGECPAPLLVHMTDGHFDEHENPRLVAQRILQMSNADGNVLIENIFLKDDLRGAPKNWSDWRGVTAPDQLRSSVAQVLFEISSPLPERYRETLDEWGYAFDSQARMLMPGNVPELVEIGFVMSAATPIRSIG